MTTPDENAVEKVIETLALISLIQSTCTLKERNKSLSGEASEKIKEAVEFKNLHRGAFNICVKLHRAKDVITRDHAIRAIRLYLDKCEETIWMKDHHVGDMVEMLNDERVVGPQNEDAEWAAAAQDNATRLQAGIKQLPPAEDAPVKRKRGRPRKDANGGASGGYRIQ